MTITKGHLYLGAMIAAGIILGAVIFRGCPGSPPHKEDVKEVKALQDRLQKVELAKAADSARLVKRSDSLQLANIDLKNKKDVADKELYALRREVRKASSDLDTARANKDTARYVLACDELQEKVRLQDEVITMYQAYADSVEANHEAQLVAKDSLLKNRQDLIVHLRVTNQITNDKFKVVSTDYGKLNRKLKRERTLSRVLAIATATAGTLLILKK